MYGPPDAFVQKALTNSTETDQPRRWLAMALTEVEKGLRKLSGYRDLPALARALAVDRADSDKACAA